VKVKGLTESREPTNGSFAGRTRMQYIQTRINTEGNAANTPRNYEEKSEHEAHAQDDPRQRSGYRFRVRNDVIMTVRAVHLDGERPECAHISLHMRLLRLWDLCRWD